MSDIPFPKSIRLAPGEYRAQSRLFHLVIRALPPTRPFRGVVAESTWEALLGERRRPAIELIAACLMPDHLHVLARPGERSIVEWVNSFKSYTTWRARQSGGPARLWQPSFA